MLISLSLRNSDNGWYAQGTFTKLGVNNRRACPPFNMACCLDQGDSMQPGRGAIIHCDRECRLSMIAMLQWHWLWWWEDDCICLFLVRRWIDWPFWSILFCQACELIIVVCFLGFWFVCVPFIWSLLFFLVAWWNVGEPEQLSLLCDLQECDPWREKNLLFQQFHWLQCLWEMPPGVSTTPAIFVTFFWNWYGRLPKQRMLQRVWLVGWWARMVLLRKKCPGFGCALSCANFSLADKCLWLVWGRYV